jgi:hypothetical protein
VNITSAHSTIISCHPVLDLQIDGHHTYVLEPKLTLLRGGIVVLLDDDRYWERTISAEYRARGEPPVRLPGATDDPAVVALVKRFAAGEQGDLLAAP